MAETARAIHRARGLGPSGRSAVRLAAALAAGLLSLGSVAAADLSTSVPSWSYRTLNPAGALTPPPVVPAPPSGLAGIVLSRTIGPLAYAHVDAERTDWPSPRLPPGGVVTGPDGRFFIPLDSGLWTVGALAYGTWHRRPAVPVGAGTVTHLIIRVP